MGATTTLTIRVPQEMKAEIEALAQATGRNMSYLSQEALRRYLAIESWQIAEITEAVQEADAGDFATDAEMDELLAEFAPDRNE